MTFLAADIGKAGIYTQGFVDVNLKGSTVSFLRGLSSIRNFLGCQDEDRFLIVQGIFWYQGD